MIDEYKRAVVTLKKKIKQLQQEREDLKLLQSKKVFVFTDKYGAMKQLKQSAKRLGLTPEMFFRAADTLSMEIVTTKRLGEIFKSVARLHDDYVKELLDIFDVDKMESISKDEYHQTLEMYGINVEYGSNYNRNSFSKFIYFLKKEKYDDEIGFIKMDPNKIGYVTRELFVAFTQSLNNWDQYLTTREIQAAFQFMDVSQNDSISRDEYLQSFRKLPAAPEIQKIEHQKINTLRKLLLVKGIKLSKFILGLMLSIEKPNIGITFEVFSKFSKNHLNLQDSFGLFKLMDSGQRGSIDYDELMSFYYITKSIGEGFDIVFAILARKLQAMDISIERYLKKEQIYEDTQLTLEQFHQLSDDLFAVQDYFTSESLFQALDLDNSGIVTASEIIEFTNKALKEFDLKLREEEKTQKTLAFDDLDYSQIDVANLDPVEQLLYELKKYKTSITEKDRFNNFEYIFTNEIACLVSCLEIITVLRKSKLPSWQDPEFGPNKLDPYGANSIYRAENLKAPGWPDSSDIIWKRIQDIEPEWMFLDEEGANANDVLQSQFLGDCWFISALTIIASDDKYLIDQKNPSNGLYPKIFHFLSKYGIFVIKFNKMFRNVYVVIDDRVCTYNGKLMFGECRSNREWWVPIIEKAYAKLHFCYEALTSGDIAQALFDLTGLPSTRVEIVPKKVIEKNEKQEEKLNYEHNNQIEKNKLLSIFKEGKKNKNLMGCSTHGAGPIYLNQELTGLYRGHAYSILHFLEIKDESNALHNLVMLRNPWGYGEWNLKWSDGSAQIQQKIQLIDNYFDSEIERCEKLQIEPPERYVQGQEDGIFLMNLSDFRNIFNTLFICINFQEQWNVLRAYDSFKLEHIGVPTKNARSQALYPYRNPRYLLEINHPFPNKKLFITLSQKDGRLNRKAKYPYENKLVKVILCVFQLSPNETELTKFDPKKLIVDSKLLSLRRDIDTGVFDVSNGKYILIPAAHKPNVKGDYVISIYFDFPPSGIIVASQTESQFLLQPKLQNSLMTNQTLIKLHSQL